MADTIEIDYFTEESTESQRNSLPRKLNYYHSNPFKNYEDQNDINIQTPTLSGQFAAPEVAVYHDEIQDSSRKRFILLNRWEGHITEFDDLEVHALVHDQMSDEIEMVTFDINEFDQEDRALIKNGRFLEWQIGYSENPTRKRVSEIRIRRIPALTEDAIRRADKRSEHLIEKFTWQ